MPAKRNTSLPPIRLVCEHCGKPYRQWPYRAATSKYCTFACSIAAQSAAAARREIIAPACPQCGGARIVLYRTNGKPVYRCKPCRAKKERSWLEANPNLAAERYRQKYAKDPQKGIALARKWYQANTDRAAATGRLWRQANQEQVAESNRRWRKANPERHAATARRWQAANPARVQIIRRAGDYVRRALKRGALVRPSACENCGQTGVKIEAAHRDYSHPLDVRWLCRPCHRRWDYRDPKTISSVTHSPTAGVSVS